MCYFSVNTEKQDAQPAVLNVDSASQILLDISLSHPPGNLGSWAAQARLEYQDQTWAWEGNL